MDIKATIRLIENGVEVKFTPEPADELEHEVAVKMFTEREVKIVPDIHGEHFRSATFTIVDADAFAAAKHDAENRKRIRDKRPTLEQEAEAKKAAEDKAAAEARAAEQARTPVPALPSADETIQ